MCHTDVWYHRVERSVYLEKSHYRVANVCHDGSSCPQRSRVLLFEHGWMRICRVQACPLHHTSRRSWNNCSRRHHSRRRAKFARTRGPLSRSLQLLRLMPILLLLLLAGCSPAHRYYLSMPQSVCSKYTQGRIYLPAQDGLSVEFILSCTEWGYINNCSFGFAEQTIPITLVIDGVSYPFFGERLEGCQRVLIPPQATQLLIRALLDKYPIQLTAGPYQTLLQTHNFTHLYGKLNQL